jgi:hypothetical protein
MKQTLSTVFFALLMTTTTFAASHKPAPKVMEAPTPAPQMESTSANSSIVSQGHQFGVDVGAGIVDPKFHFGLGARLEFPISVGNSFMRVGVQSGFYFGPSSPTSWMIPILAIGSYQFNTTGTLKPYLGLGLGATIFHASSVGTSTKFMFLFKPGFAFGQDEKYYFELPLGTLDGTFVVIPSVGTHF